MLSAVMHIEVPYKIIHKCFATQSIISSKFKGHAPQGIKFYNCYLQNGSAVYLHSIYFWIWKTSKLLVISTTTTVTFVPTNTNKQFLIYITLVLLDLLHDMQIYLTFRHHASTILGQACHYLIFAWPCIIDINNIDNQLDTTIMAY